MDSAKIAWRRLLDGTLQYELPWAALDDARFERIARGFGSHYDLDWQSANGFGFSRGEGYTKLQRLDAFGYVDRGTVERLTLERPEMDIDAGDNVVLLPTSYRALRFTLNMRVILIFWLILLMALSFAFLDHIGAWPLWGAGFLAIYAVHIALVMKSLRRKLTLWLARTSWN